MTTIKKEPDLFYLLYLLKIIFLDLFAEIHKSYVTLHCQGHLSDFKFWVQVLVKMNQSLWFFVYNSGTKYGK